MSRLEQLQKFLALDPNDSFTRYAIGLEYASQKMPERAIETFEALRAHDPAYVPTYYQLAAAYRDLKQPEKATAIYREGIARARAEKDQHAASELAAALEELEEENDS